MWKFKDGYYYEEDFGKKGVKVFSSTASLGDMKDEKNRKDFLKKYFGNNIVTCGEQIHGDNIRIVEEKDSGKVLPQTDGLITCQKGIILAVFTADCLPVFIFDKIKKIIGLIHAGQVGLSKFIIEKAINIFIKNFSSNLSDVYTAIGPHICKECYNVNLDAMAEEQFKKTGVSNINNSKLCTYTDDFFSYRKTKTSKRMVSLMAMGM
ncbi:MAG: polyphenol oxidase family protein [Elusimicrobiota bacterium]